jgi:hypothetical protein
MFVCGPAKLMVMGCGGTGYRPGEILPEPGTVTSKGPRLKGTSIARRRANDDQGPGAVRNAFKQRRVSNVARIAVRSQ